MATAVTTLKNKLLIQSQHEKTDFRCCFFTMELADHPQRQGFAIQLSTEKDSIKHPISQLNLFPI